jgi:DNA helicase-2/ATP-dependent DNA helicase PcrA
MLPSGAVNVRPAYLNAAEDLRVNPGQWQAYESRGNCVILAGPGSGKTKTLTTKIARMLAEDVRPPRGIACLTYNTECVRELRRRFDDLGVHEAHNIFIGTVHGFCLKHILLPYGRLAAVDLPYPLTVASPKEQARLFEIALGKVISANEPPSRWTTEFDRYRRTYLDRNSDEWWSEDGQLAELVETYERLLRERNLVDFDDMVLYGMRIVEGKPWVREALRARFPILTVDEYQDLGVSLHRIVVILCRVGGVRLLAVGDPDQSIYGFVGAQPELLQKLCDSDGIEVVRLRFNYRCGATIVTASETILQEKRGYEAKGGYSGTIDLHECIQGLDEQAERICSMIIPEAVKRRPGRSLGDIAVLYLDRNDGDVIAEHADRGGIKFIRIDRGAPYSKTPLTRWLEDCALWCSGGWKLGKPRFSMLARMWIGFNGSIQTEREAWTLRSLFVRFLFSCRAADLTLRDWLIDFNEACLRQTLAREPTLRDEVEAFDTLLKACGKGGKLEHFTIANFGKQGGAPDHLNLITLHSAKGREFDVVVMMGIDQGKIPSWSASSARAKQEARRLFYVGLTRAKHEIHMTFSGWRTAPYGRIYDDGPSEFLIEIQNLLLQSQRR